MSIQCKTTQVSKVGLADEVRDAHVHETHLKAAAWWPGRDGYAFHASSICEQATDGLVIGTPAPNDGCWHTMSGADGRQVGRFGSGLKW